MAAIQHGVPGEWAKVQGTVRSLWPVLVCCVLLGAFLTALVTAAFLGRGLVWVALLFAATLGVTAVFARKGLRRVESYFKGARGEEHVAAILASLPQGYHVFHDFKAKSYHIDHVVVGAVGVVSVETKNWAGPVTVEEDHLLAAGRLPTHCPVTQAKQEAAALRAVLSARGWEGDVLPLLCFASDSFQPGCAVVGGTQVVNAEGLLSYLAKQSAHLSEAECERLVTLMETAV